jgi:hypothetical protein
MKIRASLRPVAALSMLLAGSGCNQDRQATSTNASVPMVAEREAPPVTAAAPGKFQALPRAVGEVALGMARSEVESNVGRLSCHENAEGFDVCRPTDPARGERGLEVFLYHDKVISLAREIPPPEDVWSHLEELNGRYGKPSLNGLTERDRSGRLHEVYGWRDGSSLYSVRFIWQESVTQPRRLIGTAVTLWDRQAYAAWEKDAERRSTGHSALPADLT